MALCSGQKALWFLYHLAPDSSAYHVLGPVRLRERLAAAPLEAAFLALVRRHAALRSTFHAVDGEPECRLTAEERIDFAVTDAASWSASRIQEYLAGESFRPFDLERGPMLRVRLVYEAGGSSLLLVAVHHIVADFWSFAVLMSELGVLYRAELGEGTAELPPLRRTYADWIEDQ